MIVAGARRTRARGAAPVASGDFERFYDLHAAEAYTLALRVLADGEAAERVVEAAFVAAWGDGRAEADDARALRLFDAVWRLSRARLRYPDGDAVAPAPTGEPSTSEADVRAVLELVACGGLRVLEAASLLGVPAREVRRGVLAAMRDLRSAAPSGSRRSARLP